MAGWDYFFARYLILHPLRFLFDHPFWYYANFYLNNKFMSYLACDCKPCHSGIAISRNYRYGDTNDEMLDVLVPTESGTIHKGPLIYAHGGGWFCVNRELLMQSITPFVRAGYTVYIIDYPMAPENKFPVPLISMLKAISWVKRHTGHASVTLLGDSAGGNLVTMAAALVSNTSLLAKFSESLQDNCVDYHRRLGKSIERWDFPAIDSVVSIYGVLDQTIHLCKRENMVATNNMNFISRFFFNAQISILNFCFHSYRSPKGKALFGEMLTLGDLLQSSDDAFRMESFPPLFLACSDQDPLLSHSLHVHRLMKRKQFQCELFTCGGIHSFHGLPIHLTFGYWRFQSFLATKHILKFTTRGQIDLEMDKDVVVNFDFLFVLFLVVVFFGIPNLLYMSALYLR